MKPKVSIIIPVYNASNYLQTCIDHVKRLDYDGDLVEIYAIDNGSTDNSVEILRAGNIPHRIEPDLSISGLRNVGASCTEGDILAFVDSDCYVDKQWLKIAVGELTSDESIGIIGSYYCPPTDHTWVEKTWHDIKLSAAGAVTFLSSGNMLMRRDVFEEVGGFSEDVITGEDFELCQRVRIAGYRIVNNPKIISIHMGNAKKLTDIIRKERWYGLGMFATLRNGEVSKPLLLAIMFFSFLLCAMVGLIVNMNLFWMSFAAMIAMPFLTSYYMTRHVIHKRFSIYVKCLPMSLCYILGRSLSLFDMVKSAMTNSRI